ncbi:hypothetical protein CLCR_01016 [Cladophialophora carrionii]|uniref:Uncharacterized protein n=1 Tax=Cladophialophora carrionii TaxID=86049 RepID=A0A1C1D125_9EURO|nr:hypothetical protein CLCR_01016 [Cladophialophora carrionii]
MSKIKFHRYGSTFNCSINKGATITKMSSTFDSQHRDGPDPEQAKEKVDKTSWLDDLVPPFDSPRSRGVQTYRRQQLRQGSS